MSKISPNVTSESGIGSFSATQSGSVEPVKVGMRSGSEESKMRPASGEDNGRGLS